jgi:5-methyltetrahydrofolate corrinoid/iron sulfur protein methyltransferase
MVLLDLWRGEFGRVGDGQLTTIAKGEPQDVVVLINGMLDGNEPDRSSLPKRMLDYAKTVDIILGKTLYSDPWLEE